MSLAVRMITIELLVLLTTVGVIVGLPTGAPQSACLTFKPNHKGIKAQLNSKIPYTVTMSSNTFQSPKDQITVTLKSADGKTPFKGFLIAAKNEAGKAYGSWMKTQLAHELSSCSAITHNNNNSKVNVELKWQPPANATTGKVLMTAAVVQNFSTFWVNIAVKIEDSLQTSASTTSQAIYHGTANKLLHTAIKSVGSQARIGRSVKTSNNPNTSM